MQTTPNQTVMLINPRATYYNEIAQKCFPPMNLLYLAAALQERSWRPVVLDANAFRMTDEQIADRIREAKPLVVGLSVFSEILTQIRDLTRLVRGASPRTRIVLGGPHVNAVPRRSMEQFGEADFLLLGEGERSLPALCDALRTGGEQPRPEALASVPGLMWREDGRIREGAALDLPDDLDRLPWPARDLIEDAYQEKRYYSIMVRKMPVDTLFTSRGCPFRCGFCYNFRFKYRPRTPEDVVHELASIRDRGIRDVEICDDTFTANRRRAIEILDLIIKEKLDISFRIKSRVDVFKEDLAAKAAEAGVYLVAFGTESASQRMLEIMNKKVTVEQSAQAIHLCRKYRMLSHSSWIFGYPGETRESIEETYNFVMRHKPSTANFAVLRPYPATEAYQIAADSGALVGEWDPDAEHMPWVRLPWAPEKAVLDEICRKIMRRVYFHPYYMYSFGNQIVRGANWKLGRYAMQESMKVFGLRR